jgi:hypothetical protein
MKLKDFLEEVVMALLRYDTKRPEENHEKCWLGYPVP